MKILTNLLPALLLFFFVAACGSEASSDAAASHDHAAEPAPPAAETEAPATLEDGVQVIEITVGPTGYRPKRIALQEGIPARLIFTRTADSSCSTEVQSPDLGVEKTALPMEEPVAIEFTPDESGEFTFACGMHMIDGTVVVRS